MLFKTLLLLVGLTAVSAFSCGTPKWSHTGYSTTDGFFHFKTTYIVEFSLQCDSPIRDASFYAVINGKTYQVAQSEETSKFQVSWQLEHAESGSQTFDIHIYDDEKYAAYQRDGASTQPLFTIQHYHPGLSYNRFFYAESFITVVALAAVYYAYTLRGQLKA
uniref:Translocon-associated protein subunit delta n=1 Tax=Panagrolaimus sp. ES5 TaxID=591445 RepID=A0AC34GN10_9BILA